MLGPDFQIRGRAAHLVHVNRVGVGVGWALSAAEPTGAAQPSDDNYLQQVSTNFGKVYSIIILIKIREDSMLHVNHRALIAPR